MSSRLLVRHRMTGRQFIASVFDPDDEPWPFGVWQTAAGYTVRIGGGIQALRPGDVILRPEPRDGQGGTIVSAERFAAEYEAAPAVPDQDGTPAPTIDGGA